MITIRRNNMGDREQLLNEDLLTITKDHVIEVYAYRTKFTITEE
jgi:hypothetical protein